MKKMTVLVISLALALACGKKQETKIEEKPIPVTTAAVALSNLTLSRTYTGTLEGWKQARIYASIPEAVVELPIKEGGEVKQGQAVIVLDKDGPSSHFQQAQAMYNDAKDNFEKMSRLYEQGAISQQTYNNLKTNLDVSKANYEAARQQVELTSPISGILTDLTVNIGQYVPVGMPLATVAQADKMRMTLYVDSRSVANLRIKQTAQIIVAGFEGTDYDFQGEVIEIARSADPETRLFRAELQIDNPGHILSPGMFARASIVVQVMNNVLTVPREAVFSTEGIAKVYVLDGDRAHEKSIEIGEGTLELYQVIAGLVDGQKVIVLGRGQVSDGSLVSIVEADSINAAEKSGVN